MSSTRRGPVSTGLVVRDADDAMDLDAATPQMNVLGRDGRDLVVPMAGDSLEENSAGMQRRRHRQQQWRPPSPDSRVHPDSARSEDSWWKRVQGILSPASSPSKEASLANRTKVDTMASDTADPSLETNYTSFAEETSENTRSTSRRGLRRAAAKAAPSATDSFMLPSSEDPSSHFQLIPEEDNNVSTREDQIRQDCSFFFRSDETSSSNWNRTDDTRNRASLAPSWSLQQLPRERAEYNAKYQQLNQPYDQDSDDEDNVEYYYYQQMENDLSLDTNDKLTLSSSARQEAIEADVANHSTLYYYDGEIGRLLLRLPRDQVRLVMDTDLEPGILSVEQDLRRPQTKAPSAFKRNAGISNNASSSLSPAVDELPKLNYVLTVSDDLYKRIVSEMSDELTSRYGCYRCCKEGPEHVDIKVAWGILALVLILLLVNTLLWGPLD